jgi:hypothetical protein
VADALAATQQNAPGSGISDKLAEFQSPEIDDLAYKLVTLGISGGDHDIGLLAGKVRPAFRKGSL